MIRVRAAAARNTNSATGASLRNYLNIKCGTEQEHISPRVGLDRRSPAQGAFCLQSSRQERIYQHPKFGTLCVPHCRLPEALRALSAPET